MEKNLKIEKLSDIVEWADGKIRDGGYYEEKYNDDSSTAYCSVKAHELWRIRDTVLKGMESHSVYTNVLNNDIADKAAKIDLLEKEIEGRKEGYYALKEKYDVALANKNEEIENLKKELDARGEEIKKLAEKVKHQKENLDGINKTLEIRTKENERLIAVKNNQAREIEAHESENKRLSEKIIELKRSFNDLREEMANRYIAIETHNDICKTYESENESLKKQVEYLKKELNQTCTCKELDLKGHQSREMALVNTLADKNDEIKKLKEENSRLSGQYNYAKKCKDYDTSLMDSLRINNDDLKEKLNYYKNQERIRTDQLRATERKVEELWKEIEKFTKGEEDDYGRAGFKRYIEHLIEEEERAVPERFKTRLNEEITAIFTKEEETEVNDIPCGEDSIE